MQLYNVFNICSCFIQVQWYENSMVPHPERVSPWEIEPFVAPVSLNHLPETSSKRPGLNTLPDYSNLSILGNCFNSFIKRVFN